MARRKSRQRGREAELLTASVYTKASGEKVSFQPGSGSRWHRKGDLISRTHLIEVKSFSSPTVVIRRRTLERLAKQAAQAGRIPLLSVVSCGRAWAVVEASQVPDLPLFLQAGREQISFRTQELDIYLISLQKDGKTPVIGLSFEGSSKRYALTDFNTYANLQGS